MLHVSVGGHKVALRTAEDPEGRLVEIAFTLSKEGAAYRSLMESFAQSVSLGLRQGVPLADYVDAFAYTRFGPAGAVEGDPAIPRATSVLDWAFRRLALDYLGRRDLPQPSEEDVMPDSLGTAAQQAPLLPMDLPRVPAGRRQRQPARAAGAGRCGWSDSRTMAGRTHRGAVARTRHHAAGARGAARQLRALHRGRRPGRGLRPDPDAAMASIAYTGKLGAEVSVEDGQAAARLCLVNVLAQLRAACGGDLDRVRRVLRLGGFIAATPEFTEHARVMNGASDLAVEVFGEAGRHARSTIGVPSLPGDAAVEVEGLFAIG